MNPQRRFVHLLDRGPYSFWTGVAASFWYTRATARQASCSKAESTRGFRLCARFSFYTFCFRFLFSFAQTTRHVFVAAVYVFVCRKHVRALPAPTARRATTLSAAAAAADPVHKSPRAGKHAARGPLLKTMNGPRIRACLAPVEVPDCERRSLRSGCSAWMRTLYAAPGRTPPHRCSPP